jgi:hypothetical protein
MWTVEGKPVVDFTLLNDLKPVEVLYDVDGPRIFIAQDYTEQELLAYQCGEEGDVLRFLVVPFSSTLTATLKAGQISILEALSQSRLWIVDMSQDWSILKVWGSAISSVPKECLPESYAMLWPALQPAIRFRAIGAKLAQGTTVGSTVRKTIENVEKALKKLFECAVGSAHAQGKPAQNLRKLYDLPTQRFAYNSFEVSFSMPPDPTDEEETAIRKVQKYLEEGLAWMTAPAENPSIGETDQQCRAVLEALLFLAPVSMGQIDRVEISGTLANRLVSSVALTRRDRTKIKKALKEIIVEPELTITCIGEIMELDRENLIFEIRHIEDDPKGSQDRFRCVFEEELADDVMDAFTEAYKVKVSGKKRANETTVRATEIFKV